MVVGVYIDSTKKKCQKIINFQGYRLWKVKNMLHPKLNYTSKCYLKIGSNDMEIT